jgi:hypothetical protein
MEVLGQCDPAAQIISAIDSSGQYEPKSHAIWVKVLGQYHPTAHLFSKLEPSGQCEPNEHKVGEVDPTEQ